MSSCWKRLMGQVIGAVSLALALLMLGLGGVSAARTLGADADTPGAGGGHPSCRPGDRGRLIRYERVASHPTAASRASLLRRVGRLLPGLLPVPAGHPRHVQLRLRQLQGDVLHGRRGAPRSVEGAADDRHGHGLGAAQVRTPLDRRLSARHVRLVLRRGVESEHLRRRSARTERASTARRRTRSSPAPASSTSRPDYLGLGDSTVPRHRYFHAATEASSAVDLLAASRGVLASLHVQQNDKLFTFGFSQGGHSALALHRELQEAHVDVTGTATVGGVFDVEQWFLASLANETTATLPLYVSYILLAYDDVYDVYGADVGRLPAAVCVDRGRPLRHAALLRRRARRTAADHARCSSHRPTTPTSPRTRRIRCASACARTPWIGGGRTRPCASTTAPTTRRSPTKTRSSRSTACETEAPT